MRSILVGQSATAEAWTDCSKYIAIERNFVKALDNGMNGAVKLVLLLIHEHCHFYTDDDHDFNFYRNFHTISQVIDVGKVARSILLAYDDEIAKTKRKPSPKLERAFLSVRNGKQSKSLTAYIKKKSNN